MGELGEEGATDGQAAVDVPRQREAGDEGRAQNGGGQKGLPEGLGELHVDISRVWGRRRDRDVMCWWVS